MNLIFSYVKVTHGNPVTRCFTSVYLAEATLVKPKKSGLPGYLKEFIAVF